MELLQYTSYAEIRAAIGVNDIELSDTTLALPLYAQNLSSELEEVDAGLVAAFEPLVDLDVSQMTAKQRRFFETTRVFATYAVAKQLASNLSMFAPKDVSDSKTLVSRFSDSPYKEAAKNICAQYDLAKTRVAKALGELNTTDKTLPSRTMMAVSSPSTDRVTG